MILLFLGLMLKSVLWGIAENRLFNCNNNKALFSGNFRISLYHIWLFIFFTCVNAPVSYVSSPIVIEKILFFAFFALWDILILDVTWWIIRWIHFKVLPFEMFVKYYNGEKNGWHLKTDFDSAGLPLWFGTYSWWFILSFILSVFVIYFLW